MVTLGTIEVVTLESLQRGAQVNKGSPRMPGDTLDSIRMLEYSAGFEILRNAVRNELREESVDALAVRVGVQPRALRRFLSGAKPSLHLWQALTDLMQDRAPGLPHHGRLGLAVIVDTVRPKRRERARRALARALASFLRAEGEKVPGWLHEELRAE
jgi:hypothetical protein